MGIDGKPHLDICVSPDAQNSTPPTTRSLEPGPVSHPNHPDGLRPSPRAVSTYRFFRSYSAPCGVSREGPGVRNRVGTLVPVDLVACRGAGVRGWARSPIRMLRLRRTPQFPALARNRQIRPDSIREFFQPWIGLFSAGYRGADELGLDKSLAEHDRFIQQAESIRTIGRYEPSPLLLTPRLRQKVQGTMGVRCSAR